MKTSQIKVTALLLVLLAMGLQAQSLMDFYRKSAEGGLKSQIIYDAAADEAGLLEGRFSDLARDSQGNFYFLCWSDHQILKFDSCMTYVKTFGRKGQGPGEFGSAFNLLMTADDDILVNDTGNRRLSLYDTEGELVRLIPYNELFEQREWPREMAGSGNGRIYIKTEKYQRGSKPGTASRLHTIYSFDSQLQNKKAITSWTTEKSMPKNWKELKVRAFEPETLWAPSPEGQIVLGRNDEEHFEIVDENGTVTKRVDHGVAAMAVTDIHKQAYYKNSAIAGPNGEMIRGDSPEAKKKTEFPKCLPFYSQILIDDEGNILLRTYNRGEESRVRHFTIFDKAGAFLEQLQMGLGLAKPGFRHGAYFEMDAKSNMIRYSDEL